MTVRNIRSHASRRLLPAPQLRGRTAYYGPEHLARLQLIAGLQRQGFSLAAIEAVVRQTPAGSAEHALAFYRGILAPWQPEDPEEMAYSELAEWLGIEPEPETLDRLHAAGILEPVDAGPVDAGPVDASSGNGPGGAARVRITNPALLRAGAQTVRLGIPVDAVLALRPELLRHTRAISELFVGLFRDTIWCRYVDRGAAHAEMAEVHRIVEALQPVAAQALLAAFRSTMPEAIEAFIRAEYERLSEDAERNG